MNRENALGLKAQIDEEISPQREDDSLQSFVDDRLERRLAVGFSKTSEVDYRLELRIQRKGGHAQKLAERYVDLAQGEANIAVFTRLEIPSLKELASATRGNLRRNVRPLHLGLSISSNNGGTGSIGCFVELPQGDAILTAAHVLTRLRATDEETPVFQPGRADRRVLVGSSQIAKLKDYTEIAREARNELDAAVALVRESVDHNGNVIPPKLGTPIDGKRIGANGGEHDLKLGDVVQKIGRTTELTEGTITATEMDGAPIFSSYLGNLLFDNIIEVTWPSKRRPFSRAGDSGSLAFTKIGHEAVGIVFAGGEIENSQGKTLGVSFLCSLANTLEAFDARFI